MGRDRGGQRLAGRGGGGESRRWRRRTGRNCCAWSEPGLSIARNAGLAAARTPWVAYIDDDAAVAPDWAGAIATAVARLPHARRGPRRPDRAGLGGALPALVARRS